MAAPMLRFICREAPPVCSFFLQTRSLTHFLVQSRVPVNLNPCIGRQYIRNLSTMQSMRIPTQKVYRPFPPTENDLIKIEMYKLKKNLELRRFIPIVPFIRVLDLVKKEQIKPISNTEGSELLGMTGEVLNVLKIRRRLITIETWGILKSCKGYRLDVSNYTNYLMACKENELMINVTRLQEEMTLAGLSPDQEFFEELVGFHAAHGQLDCVKKVLENMSEAKFPMTAKTFSNYIWAAFNAGHEDEVTSILESMSSHGVSPDLNIYVTMMKCWAVKGDLTKITELIKTAEMEAGMKQIHQIQLLLPLLMNHHKWLAGEVFAGLSIPDDVDKVDMGEIEYYGNQLIVNMFLQEGFDVFNLSWKTAQYVIRSYARGPSKRTVVKQSLRNLDQRAAQLTVQMLLDNVVSLQRLLLEAKTISEGYTTCIILEMKKQGRLESYHQLCSIIQDGPVSKYFNDQSKKVLQTIGKACLKRNNPSDPSDTKILDVNAKGGRGRSTLLMFAEAVENGNDDEVVRLFNEMKEENINTYQLSNIANHIRVVYKKNKKFENAIYFQNEMIQANPSFSYNFNRVVYMTHDMLASGEHRGILPSIKNYLDIVTEMGTKTTVIQKSQVIKLMKILAAFLNPAEVLQILGKLMSLQELFNRESRTFFRIYLERDVTLAIEALEELVKYTHYKHLFYLQIMVELAREDDQHLIRKVFNIARREGEQTANLLQICAYLTNGRVEKATLLHQITEGEKTKSNQPLSDVADLHVMDCLLQLHTKPDMLNEFVRLQDSPTLRKNLARVLRSDAGSSLASLKREITEYMITSPETALTVACLEIVKPEDMELEKLKLQMRKKV